MKKTILIIFSLVLSFYSFAQKNDSKYILIKKSSLLFEHKNDCEFFILKYKFRTKTLQKQYLDKLKPFELQENFYINFYCTKKYTQRQIPKNVKIFNVEDLSKGRISINNKTKVIFIEKFDCISYNIYETYMLLEE